MLTFFRTFGIITVAIAISIALLILIITSTNTLTVIEDKKPVKVPIPTNECIDIENFKFTKILIGIPNCITMKKDEERIRLSFVTKPYIPQFGLSSIIRSSFSGSYLTLRLANANDSWQWLTKHLNENNKIGIYGQLNYWIEKNFGSNFSFKYEFLPMLTGPTNLYFGKNESGALIFAIEGIMKNSNELSKIIDKIHQEFRSSVPAIKIMKRNLENRFVALDVRLDLEAIKEKLIKHDQWKISLLKSSNNAPKEIVTAQRGSTFVISNNEDALMEILRRDKKITPPSSSSLTTTYRLADGVIDKITLIKILKPATFLEDLSYLPDKFTFSVEQRGEVSLITIE